MRDTWENISGALSSLEKLRGGRVPSLVVGMWPRGERPPGIPVDEAIAWAESQGLTYAEACIADKEALEKVLVQLAQQVHLMLPSLYFLIIWNPNSHAIFTCYCWNSRLTIIFHSGDCTQVGHERAWIEWRTTLLDLPRSVSERTRAAFYLRTCGDARSSDTLGVALQQLQDGALMRHGLAYVLGQMCLPRACATLPSVLTEDLLVRHECAEALGAICDCAYLPVLEKLRSHPQPEVAETCEIAAPLACTDA